MKIFYIDDSFFRDTPFLIEMRKRLFHLCRRQQVSMVLISCSHGNELDMKEFLKMCKKFEIEVICSPASFDFQGIRGVLSTNSALIENYPPMYSYSGSVVCFYLDEGSCERLYLDLFPNKNMDFFKEDLTEEIEHMIGQFMEQSANKKRFN